MAADQRLYDTISEVLADHQWEFESRYFCTCGAAINPVDGEPADKAMAGHQAEAIEDAGFPV